MAIGRDRVALRGTVGRAIAPRRRLGDLHASAAGRAAAPAACGFGAVLLGSWSLPSHAHNAPTAIARTDHRAAFMPHPRCAVARIPSTPRRRRAPRRSATAASRSACTAHASRAWTEFHPRAPAAAASSNRNDTDAPVAAPRAHPGDQRASQCQAAEHQPTDQQPRCEVAPVHLRALRIAVIGECRAQERRNGGGKQECMRGMDRRSRQRRGGAVDGKRCHRSARWRCKRHHPPGVDHDGVIARTRRHAKRTETLSLA